MKISFHYFLSNQKVSKLKGEQSRIRDTLTSIQNTLTETKNQMGHLKDKNMKIREKLEIRAKELEFLHKRMTKTKEEHEFLIRLSILIKRISFFVDQLKGEWEILIFFISYVQ